MAETVAGILGPAVGDVLKWMGAQIKRQFTYLCCFSSNITSLRNEAQELEANTGDNDVFVISGEVENWLKESKDIKGETDEILNEVPTVESGCLKLGARFSLSKRAKETADRSNVFRDQCKFEEAAISQPGPPAATKAVPLPATYHEFDSRKQIEGDIMATLRGGDVRIMGICGMGGVGKTTVAGRIRNKALENNVFNEALMVVVSQPVDKLKIQLEIGRSLGLKKLEKESLESRKQKILERLSGTKRILLILDDVWKKLELQEVGIPCKHKGCTILITSRNRNVFKEMNVQDRDDFGMEELSDEDAWIVFRGRVGTCVDDNKLNSVAKDVVKKCKGLPLGLTTLGAALKDEHAVPFWRNALRELEKVQPGIPEYIEDVYNPLKLSYDFLGSKEHKLVFLLCGLYPEDADIPVNLLVYFSIGLGIYEGGIVENARDWMFSSTRILINRSLLLESVHGDNCVRMHDVVRDVCKFISKEEGYDCSWISLSQRYELPTTFPYPNLCLLFLIRNRNTVEFKLDIGFLEEVKDLYVLYIERLSVTSLPPTTQSLKSLKTMILYACKGLETLSVIGELVNLKILICRNFDSIEELPHEMKELNRLKLLYLIWCKNLQRIGGGIISSLVALEELKMFESFNKWEEGENAKLRELEELKRLRWLEIEIQDPAALAAAKKMYHPSKLDKFHLTKHQLNLLTLCLKKKLQLMCKKEIYLGNWIETQVLPHTEALSLTRGNVNYLARCQKLRYLELDDCEMFKESFITTMDGFYSITHLKLSNLPNLEKIWNDDRVSSNSFPNLKELGLYDLPSLKHVGDGCLPQLEVLGIVNCEIMERVFLWKARSQNSHHITKMFPKLKRVGLYNLPNLTSFYQGNEGIEFPQLTELDIRFCAKMRCLVSKGMGSNENIQNFSFQEGLYGSFITSGNHVGDQRTLLFPKLERLYLNGLSELVSFCEWECEDELSSMRDVTIENCPKMKQVWKSISSSNANIHQPEEVSFRCLENLQIDWNPFCNDGIDISFLNGLKKFNISRHDGSTSVVTSSFARSLYNLTILTIEDCGEISHVITNDEKQGMSGGESTALHFPKLQELIFNRSPKLVNFCQWKCDVELPSLWKVKIRGCPNMKNLTLGSLNAPNLEYFETDMDNYLHLQVPVR